MVGSQLSGDPLSVQAAIFRLALYRFATNFAQVSKNISISVSVVVWPTLMRMAPRADSGEPSMAASTCEAATLPEEQAEPEETAIPSRSSAIRAVSAFMPGTANSVVFG